jgi:NDP-sugar pyrophosphorylase family protein
MKERVTLTIEREILQKIDETVNSVDVKNRSHAIEMLLVKALGENRPQQAVILAGSHQKVSGALPRAMVRVQDKPLLEHNIELLKKYGVKDIIISIGEKGDMIREHFSDGREFGVSITYLEEKEPLGTAGPLQKLKGELHGAFLLLNADELKNIDLENLFDFHRKNKSLATMALTTTEDPSKYGVAVMNGHRIMTFIEKPSREHAPSKLINAGLYLFEPEVIKLVPEGFSMLEQDILPRLAKEEKLNGFVFSGQWFDTSSQQRIADAEARWNGLK